jgi:hypothetical protein
VVHRWNPAYSNSPVIGSAVNAGSLTEKITVDYAGNKIYKNGVLEKIMTGNGYYENGKYSISEISDIPVVAKDNEGNYQRTFTTDAEGNKNYNSISFEYGTVTSVQEKSLKTDAGEVTLTMFNIKGDDKATQLFEFMSNPGVTTNVEWSHDKIGTEKSEKNVVGTIHLPKNTVQGYYLSKKGYTIREDNHSHPRGSAPNDVDRDVARDILERNKNAKFNVYIGNGKYIPYVAMPSPIIITPQK